MRLERWRSRFGSGVFIMTVPKDRFSADRVGMVRAAYHISNVLSPPVMFAVTGIAFGIYERPVWPGLAWGLFYGTLTSLVPILFVGYMLRSGRIGDLHMSQKQERNLPYLIALGMSVIAVTVIWLLDGPDLLRCLAIYNIVALSLLSLINTRWLISIHATAAAGTWLMASLVFGWVVSLLLLPLVILICVVRVYLKRHTVAQVLAGVVLGVTLVLILAYFGCFVG